MTTVAEIGYGLTFEVETTPGSGTYTALAQVFNATPPSASVDQIDVTHYQSASRTRQFVAGLSDPGSATAEMNFTQGSATDAFILAWRASGLNRLVRITYSDGANVVFSATVEGYAPSIPMDDKKTAMLTMKVSGIPTFSAAAAPANVVLPGISGEPRVTQTLTAFEGVWTGAPTFTYQWQADVAGNGSYVNISAATSRTYVLAAGEQGDRVRVRVTGTNSTGSATADSFGTALVAAA
jgi:predicted secreted protein